MKPHYPRMLEQIRSVVGNEFKVDHVREVSGGCINRAIVLEGQGQRYFVKLNRAQRIEMFAAEAAGLATLRDARAIRVPEPICWGTDGDNAFLVLEHIELGRGGADEALGRQLAALHGSTSIFFGWQRDNTIGSTAQTNTPDEDWVRFWRQQRLGFQLELAAANGHGGKWQASGRLLLDHLDVFFTDYHPAPSLLHGDLWGGNWAADRDGAPVIYDPAVYFGDRETDLAMTELFGGFGPAFYRAYQESWPLDPGYATRKMLYNLYHVLNHLNLFGGSYLSQAQKLIEQLLAECR